MLGFGALKGLIFASLAFLLIVLVLDLLGGGPSRRPAWIVQARTYPLLSATSASIADVVDRRRRGKPLFSPRWQSGFVRMQRRKCNYYLNGRTKISMAYYFRCMRPGRNVTICFRL